jgi:bacillolysin
MKNLTRTAGLAALLVATAAGALPERASLSRADAVARLQANAGGQLQRSGSGLTASTLLRAPRGQTLFTDGGAGRPVERAQLFLSLYGAALGVADPVAQLRLQRVSRDAAGNAHVHLDQFHDGVPVFGARLVVHLDRAGVTGVNGVVVPGLERMPTAQLPLARLRESALAYARKFSDAASLRIESSRFVVYPIGLLSGRIGQPRLAYEALVTGGPDVRGFVFVDAGSGVGLNHISLVHTVLNREIYTPDQTVPPVYDEQASTILIPAGPADPALINDPGHNGTDVSDDSAGNPPTDNLWIYAGGTYALYDNMFGRKGYDACDGSGPCQPDTPAPAWSLTRGDDYVGQLQKSVYLINDACPNAYWNGDSTNYCPGFDADDVVSHEWSHAYTQYTHGLIYQYQSGALNESWSDIFGEAYDLLNHLEGPLGTLNLDEHKYYEEGGNRWVVGEDLSDEAAAALLRDMWKPDEFCGTALCAENPGKATSENYTCGSGDNGGVHANSSVPNHAFAMLVDGTAGQGPEGTTGTERNSYNGQEFAGIGMVKALHIYYHAMVNYQTPSTDFPQHADALRASCSDLIGVALKGPTGAVSGQLITEGDCAILDKAMLATEMDLGTPCPYIPVLEQGPPAICEGATPIFTEGWESGAGGWTKTSTGVNPEWEDDSRSLRDFVLDSTLPGDRAGTAAYARNAPLGEPGGGDCQVGSGDYSGQFTFDSPEITIPADALDLKLRFDHYVATEAGFDGGQLEVSVNGGAYELVDEENYVFNAPNADLDAAPPVGLNTNPNGGEAAWHGTDVNPPSGSPPSQWGTTIVDLTGLAVPTDKVKLRLTFSQDGCNGVDGWYVDDLQLYSCPALEAPTLTTGANYEDPDIDGVYTLEWERPAGAAGPDLLQESTVSCAPAMTEDAEDGLDRWTAGGDSDEFAPVWTDSTTKPKPLHLSTAFWASANSELTFGETTLEFKEAIVIPAGASATLRFSDWYMNEPEDKGSVEISVDGGTTWVEVYMANRALVADEASTAFATESLSAHSIDLTPYAGQTLRLRLKMFIGGSEFFAYTQYGWYVDDIAVDVGLWNDVTTTALTSHTLSGKTDGMACYRVRTAYEIAGGAMANSAFSSIVPVTVALDLNQLPVAVAGLDRLVDEGAGGTLDGSNSSDPDGDALTYAWTQVSGPDFTLTDADTAVATFTAPEVCTDELAVFELTVTDVEGLSASDQVTLTVNNANNVPLANAGEDFTVFEGTSAMLSAAASSDSDCEALSYQWAQIAGPAVEITNANTATPTIRTPEVAGDTLVRFRVVVEDADGAQAADEIDVTVINAIGDAKVGAFAPWQLLVLALGGLVGGRRRRS